MKYTFNNRIAAVTGANRGIGKEISLDLAKHGCKVLCLGRKMESLQVVVDEIKSLGGYAEAFEIDVTSSESSRLCAEKILEKYETVDILVNNAGIARDSLAVTMSDEDWDDVIKTNLNGSFYLTRELIMPMIANEWGRIIFISSITGLYGCCGLSNYSAAKAGVIGLARSLAVELGAKNITSNAIAPGLVETDLIKTSIPKEFIEKHIEKFNRMCTVQDVSAICRFYASEEGGFMNGEVIVVDGGRRM